MASCECGKTRCLECEGMCPYCGDTADVHACQTRGNIRTRLDELMNR